MSKVPTAEEYFKPFRDEDGQYGCRLIESHLREFAKLHLIAQMEAILNKAALNTKIELTDIKELLNSYPLDNIK